ncbi:MAG: hypothetical protein HQL75_00265 [Magnetococcales bacterium]|nr:hypothetical protein [Magnetococcales bacterium]
MRITKTVTIGEPPREVTIHETTVADMRRWLVWFEKANDGKWDTVTHGLFADISLTDLGFMTNLSQEEIDNFVPSELGLLVETCKEVNPGFFSLRERAVGLLQIKMQQETMATLGEAEKMLAKIAESEKDLSAVPGASVEHP